MVIRFFLLLLASTTLIAQEISVEIDEAKVSGIEQVPITIRIIHKENEKVDEHSFRKGGDIIIPRLEKVEKSSDGNVISIYTFALPVKDEGINLLPEISAVVGGKKIKTTPTTYEVRYQKMNKPLYLKFHIEGEEPFFPGQRLKFIYEIFYQGNVVLDEEELPLLDAEGFKKLGEVFVDERVDGGYTVQTLTQEVEVLDSGEYLFKESVLRGKVDNKEVSASVPSMSIVVLPFEREGQPLSFNGAIGSYSISSTLLTSPEMAVGDTARLQITISGRGDLATVNLPEIICQPGFSGFFSLSDIPPIAKIEDGKKIFILELRPMTTATNEIPSIQFSYFDPKNNLYGSTSSNPIPITVKRIGDEPFAQIDQVVKEKIDWEKTLQTTQVKKPVLHDLSTGEKKHDHWFLLWSIPLFFFLGVLEWVFKRNRKNRPQQTVSSGEILKEAEKFPEDSVRFSETVKKAIRLACREEGKDSEQAIKFFDRLDAVRYGKKELPEKGKLYQEAKQLWDSIKKSS